MYTWSLTLIFQSCYCKETTRRLVRRIKLILWTFSRKTLFLWKDTVFMEKTPHHIILNTLYLGETWFYRVIQEDDILQHGQEHCSELFDQKTDQAKCWAASEASVNCSSHFGPCSNTADSRSTKAWKYSIIWFRSVEPGTNLKHYDTSF